MRSDFWSLPYAARQAIQRGNNARYAAESQAQTIARLEAENAELRSKLNESERQQGDE